MAGQRPGPSLALVQKCGWLELAQSCCRVHLGRPAQVRIRGGGGVPHPRGLPGPACAPGASPRLQGAPAAVGVGRAHAVPAGGVRGARGDLHPGHLETEAGAQLSGVRAGGSRARAGEVGETEAVTAWWGGGGRGFPAEATAGRKGEGEASSRSSHSQAEARGWGRAQRILGPPQAEARPAIPGGTSSDTGNPGPRGQTASRGAQVPHRPPSPPSGSPPACSRSG